MSLNLENSTDKSQLAVLADEIRHFRKKNHFSLEMLAETSGVSRSMISKIERCETVPSTVTLSKLAEALGVTFSQLMAPAARGTPSTRPQHAERRSTSFA